MRKPPYVTVLAELEEWDDTTDVIVWLIEQRFFNTTLPKLFLEKAPTHHLETLEIQSADLTGYNDKLHQKIHLNFVAEQIEIPLEGDIYEEGYKVIVNDITAQTRKIGEYTIKGTNRDEFEIIADTT